LTKAGPGGVALLGEAKVLKQGFAQGHTIEGLAGLGFGCFQFCEFLAVRFGSGGGGR
jgi:hypothetical protein